MMVRADIQGFFDEATKTVTYLIIDPVSKRAAVIDPVLDYDHRGGKLSTRSAEALLRSAAQQGAQIDWILETHAHADHLSAAQVLKKKTGAQVGIGEHIGDVQRTFKRVLNVEDVSEDGREFDRLFRDGETFQIGQLDVEVMYTPGHTSACVSYRMGDAVFVGDTLFMPDYGTARADFPGGSARSLYRSIQRLFGLPSETRLFLCHDYLAEGRDQHVWETTVGEQRANNILVHAQVSEQEFVSIRERRDAALPAPNLMWPSMQVNIRAGALPKAETNGVHYLKVPLQLVEPDGAA